METRLPICPNCSKIGTLVKLKNITDSHSFVNLFCTKCSYVSTVKHGTQLTKAALNKKHIKNVSGNIEFIKQLFVDYGLCSRFNYDTFNESLMGLVGVRTAKTNSGKELILPIYHSWNYIVGKICVKKTVIKMDVGKRSNAGLLADRYDPDLLFIVDNPLHALAIRYKALKLFNGSVSVIVLLDRKVPDIKMLQDCTNVCVILKNQNIGEYLFDILHSNAILYNKEYNKFPLFEGNELQRIITDSPRMGDIKRIRK